MPTAAKPKGVYAKIAAVQAEVQATAKSGSVSFGKTNYKHMREHDLLEVLKPLLKKYNLVLLPDVSQWTREGNHLHIAFEMRVIDPEADPDGNVFETTVRMPNEAVDSGDKAMNKSLTNALKYCLQKTFLIPTEDLADIEVNDPEESTAGSVAGGGKEVNKKKASELSKKASEAVQIGGLDKNSITAKIQSEYGVDRIAQLTPKQATDFEAWLDASE